MFPFIIGRLFGDGLGRGVGLRLRVGLFHESALRQVPFQFSEPHSTRLLILTCWLCFVDFSVLRETI